MLTTEPKTNGSTTWVSIVGARPQFVKLLPVCQAIAAHNASQCSPRIEHVIVHTGQHYDRDVAGVFFEQMGIPEPDYNLAVGSGSHGTQLARMMERLERVLQTIHCDWVIIYGDTNSTLAGALVSARLEILAAHVEAGCRSGEWDLPEEHARIVADHLSRLLLAPSHRAMENLHREGIGSPQDPLARKTHFVGDVMFDALLHNLQIAENYVQPNLQKFGLESGRYYLLTLHRAQNTKNPDRLREILNAAQKLDCPVLFPIHPRTQKVLASACISVNGNIRPAGPFGYMDMIALERHSRKILTDSGGVQKEAFYLSVPCVTLRETTEWNETVELGVNQIVGTDQDRIVEAVLAPRGPWPAKEALPYGDGTAAGKIVSAILSASNGAGSHPSVARAASGD
ncbi:MAG TPA: UDP-N-acetylglucosamine 2-epimerase (non-hydrolyzing) [Candidatus Acidoferrum sp.]|nr:UDP-N-acetylglucosamine 2-epimerase (non-hydrolyzing) [Candidatus Acidoferrum sp.]